MKNKSKKILIGLGTGAIILGVSLLGGTETKLMTEVKILGTSCWKQVSETAIPVEITRQEYDSFGLRNAKPIYQANCGLKFDSPDNKLRENYYYKEGNVTYLYLKDSVIVGVDGVFQDGITFDEDKKEVKLPKSLLDIIVSYFGKTANAGISKDNISTSGSAGAVSSVTFAHTSNGSKRIIIATSGVRDTASTADYPITGETYNSIALVKILSNVQEVTTVNERSELWYLVNPPVGIFNVVITYTGTVDRIAAGAITLNGADLSNPINISGGSNGIGGTANPETQSVSVTTTVNGTWLIAATFNTTNPAVKPLSPAVGQTDWYSIDVIAGGDTSAASYKGPVAADVHTMSYTWDGTANGNQGWAMTVAAITPAQDSKILIQGQTKIQGSQAKIQ